MSGLRRLGTTMLLLLFLASCASMKQPSLKIDHYTLEYAPPKTGDLPPLTAVIKVERFSVASDYATPQMVYRDRSFKRETYFYHQWRANPRDLVTDYLSRDMRQSGLFKAVLPESSTLSPTHILEGSLDEFFEQDTEEGWRAVLTVTITLIKTKEADLTEGILFQETFHASQPCKDKSPGGVAEAMSEAMSRVSGEVIHTVYDRLKGP
jgi:ABC-type uncharacterized transport system auxiliary subunit